MAKPPQEKQVLPGVFITDFRRAPPAECAQLILTFIQRPKPLTRNRRFFLQKLAVYRTAVRAYTSMRAHAALVTHLERSNQELEEALKESPGDEDFVAALTENRQVIERYLAKIEDMKDKLPMHS